MKKEKQKKKKNQKNYLCFSHPAVKNIYRESFCIGHRHFYPLPTFSWKDTYNNKTLYTHDIYLISAN